MSANAHDAARREIAEKKLALKQQRGDTSDEGSWSSAKSRSSRPDNKWVPSHRREQQQQTQQTQQSGVDISDAPSSAPTSAPASARRTPRPEKERYVPPRSEEKHEVEVAAVALDEAEQKERERQALFEAAKQAGKEKREREAAERAKKDAVRREQQRQRAAAAAAASSAAAPLTEAQRLECILEAFASPGGGSSKLKPEDLKAALPTAQQVSPLSDASALVVFSSAASAQRALTTLAEIGAGPFTLRGLSSEGVSSSAREAALQLEVVADKVLPRTSPAVATRMITRNITLSKEDRAEARKLAEEQRSSLVAAKQAEEAERKKREGAEVEEKRIGLIAAKQVEEAERKKREGAPASRWADDDD